MTHLKKFKNLTKWFALSAYVVVVAVSFSCAKKPDTVRASRKNESINMNPAVSTQSEAQASIIYKIVAVDVPKSTSSGFSVDTDIQTPDNQFLPLTTTHDSSGSLSQGTFQDTARGAVVRVQAKCSGDGCMKYLLLVTVTKNNVALFQSAAISYKNDKKFYSISIQQGVDSFFENIDALDSYSQAHNFVARNDAVEND